MNQTPTKILIVDDDPFFRQLLVRILTAVGYQVIDTRSVSDAISALAQSPDLAIIDYRMPSNDGSTFIKDLREKGYKFPIVFCSGSGIDQKTFASLRNVYQVDMIIQKPIHPEMFIQQIAELLKEKCVNVPDEQGLEAEPLENDCHFEQELESEVVLVDELILNENNQTLDQFLRQENLLPEDVDSVITKEEEAARAVRETELAIAELGNFYLLELGSEFEQLTNEVHAASKQNDLVSLNNASNRAHQLKGTAGSLGFDDLSKIGSVLEKELIAIGKADLVATDSKWREIISLVEQATAAVDGRLRELNLKEPAIPIDADDEEATHSFDIESISTHQLPDTLLPPRVLVIASDRDLLSAIESSLAEEQIAVTSLQSSMEAFSVLDDLQPGLVLLQETMPSVSGNDLCRMIRCNVRWQTLPVLILADSKASSTESRQKLFDSGASDYILTPIAPLELKAKLKNHLRRASAETLQTAY